MKQAAKERERWRYTRRRNAKLLGATQQRERRAELHRRIVRANTPADPATVANNLETFKDALRAEIEAGRDPKKVFSLVINI